MADTDSKFSIVMSFPLEDGKESASVLITETNGGLSVDVIGTESKQEAFDQALMTLSLNVDDSGWPEVGKKDPFIGELQQKYKYLRPVLFHSPYEAAAAFIIGQRISVKQRQLIQSNMSAEYGNRYHIEEQSFYAFPTPEQLLRVHEFRGLSEQKIQRLHSVAELAMSGKLTRLHLLSMPPEEALNELLSISGIGPFYASGILFRGAGIVDDLTDDDLTKYAIMKAYSLENEPSQKQVMEIAEAWRPYRMWTQVLVHVWLRREIGLPKRSR